MTRQQAGVKAALIANNHGSQAWVHIQRRDLSVSKQEIEGDFMKLISKNLIGKAATFSLLAANCGGCYVGWRTHPGPVRPPAVTLFRAGPKT
jgi:hypothetical protein